MTRRDPAAEADVGCYFIRADGTVWRVVGYTAMPTVTFERVGGDEQVTAVVTSPIALEFRRLVPEPLA